LFCRIIKKREEHQKNMQIHTIPETLPTESVTKLCLKAMTRQNQTQSKLLNTICQKQKKTPKAGTAVGGNTTGDGACSTLAATGQTPTTA
jgi:hypothetical protein